MNQILTLEGLAKHLDLCSGEFCYLDVMQQLAIPASEFERYMHWNPQQYTRTELVRTEQYELVLVCWERGQQSYIHDYDAQEAWAWPVTGRLREERFVEDPETNQLHQVSNVILGPGEYSYMRAPVDIHRYTNIYGNRTVSLHMYAKPVEKWRVYTEEHGDTGEKPVWWDASEIAQTQPV